MSFITASDIAIAIRIGYWVYEKWFVKSNQADRCYVAFLNDVRHLSVQLSRLGDVFDKASSSIHQADLPTIQARHAQSKELVGDFLKTLEECKKLLIDNQKYVTRNGNRVVASARWHARGIESESQALRTRVQFHCTKISFIVEPLQLELLHKISQDVTIIKEQMRMLHRRLDGATQDAVLPKVPAGLAECYEQAALNDRPFDSTEPYPLKETINALLYHFSQSTVNTSGYQRPLPEQFNALLKSRWILDKVLEHSDYQRIGVCLSRSVVSSVQDKILLEYGRFEDGWPAMELGNISTLEDDCLSIWFEEQQKSLSASVTEEDVGEVKILDLPLTSRVDESEQSLLVFRQSETEFRLLQMSAGGAGVKQVMNTQTFRCVPLYAVPDTTGSTNSISICLNSVNKAEVFEMDTREDVMTVQQAFTNYKVMNNCPSIGWSISREKVYHKSLKGVGARSGIQIWHPEALERVNEPRALLPTGSAISDGSSERRPSTLADDLMARLPSKARSVISVQQTLTENEGLLASFRPKNPAIMIFTTLHTPKRGDTQSFVYIPLESGIHINKYRCGCAAPDSNCCDVILEMNPGKRNKFKVKIHKAVDENNEPNLQDWNLFLFSDPKPKAYDHIETIDDAVELHLRFDNVRDRKLFLIWLCRTIETRDQAMRDFNQVRSQMRLLEHRMQVVATSKADASITGISPRPSVVSLSPPQSRSHRASSSSSSSTARLKPQLSSTQSKELSCALPQELSCALPQELDSGVMISHPNPSTPNSARANSNPIKPVPRRLSSKTIVASPQTDIGEFQAQVPNGYASRLHTIADQDDDFSQKEAYHQRVDSGTSVSPLSSPAQTPRTIPKFLSLSPETGPSPINKQPEQYTPGASSPSQQNKAWFKTLPSEEAEQQQQQPQSLLPHPLRFTAKAARHVPSESALARALKKQREIEGNGLGIATGQGVA